jgi:hypothetical protein
LQKAGDTMTGALGIGTASSIVFEGSTADDYETTLTVADPTSDHTITFPDVTGNVVTTGDTGTVTSTMITNGTIVNADINASAAIAGTKIDPDFGSQTIETTGVFSAADGAAATPSITFTGDTNTGIYRPGADQVAISTNGTQRINIEADGDINIDSGGVFYDATNNRLAIGTTSPLGILQTSINSTDGVGLYLENRADDGSSDAIGLDFLLRRAGGGQFGGTRIRGVKENAWTGTPSTINSALTFSTFKSEVASEKLRIDSSARLLVGTSSDSGGALLQVNGNRIRVATAKTPASASDTGTAGEICWDASYVYVCTATNTWKRAALSTW